jgi:ankyrin repeat protein
MIILKMETINKNMVIKILHTILFFSFVFFFSVCSSIQERMNEYAYEGNLNSFQSNLTKIKTVNFQDERGWTPLMAAAENNQLQMIDYLIQEKAYLDIQNQSGDTALMRAVYMNQYQSAEKLIQAGASLKLRDLQGFTPFLKACEKGKWEMAKLLVKDKADFKDRTFNSLKKTPLHLAMKKGNLELLAWLIENGSDVNAKDEEGKTPLMYAITEKLIPQVKMLLEKGSSTTEISYKGDTIFTLAKQSLNSEMIALLESGNRVEIKKSK